MQTRVSGKHIDVGDALRTHVEEHLAESVTKYFDRPVDAAVVFSRDGHAFKCDASVHLSTGLTAKAEGQHADIYAAFEYACARIEKQLRRYKRRLKNHHQERSQPVEVSGASSYILASEAEESEPETLQPIIVAEMETRIPALSVGEAVMQMELAGAPVLVFKNEKGGGVNVVYRRDDGNVGWIDPATVT